jgi:hypothetical protein
MQVQIHFVGTEASDVIERYARQISTYRLGSFGDEVRSVDVWLTNVGSPNAKLGVRCKIMVRGPSLHATKLDVLSSDPMLAIDAAAEWAGRTVAALLDDGGSPKRRLRQAS